jgi:hypothetical protein
MKHILNNLSEEEKNAIREQHSGGMKVMTENFNKLLNSKLGDAKPLVNEQVLPQRPNTVRGLPIMTFKNKTVNVYFDPNNTKLLKRVTLMSEPKMSNDGVITIDSNSGHNLEFNCSNPKQLRIKTEEGTYENAYNNNLIKSLVKTYCSKSSSGVSVPKSDFASNSSNTGEDFV